VAVIQSWSEVSGLCGPQSLKWPIPALSGLESNRPISPLAALPWPLRGLREHPASQSHPVSAAAAEAPQTRRAGLATAVDLAAGAAVGPGFTVQIGTARAAPPPAS